MRQPPRAETETPYERHKGVTMGVLRKRCPWLAPDEREAAYHDAYVTLLEKDREGALDMDAMHEQQVRAYLLTVSVHRGLRAGASAESRRTRPVEDPAAGLTDPATPIDEGVALASEAAALRELVEELPERRRAVIKLRFWLDRAPEEIEAFLGISHRTYRKEVERAFRQLADRFELVREGKWCEERRAVVVAYVAGAASPTELQRARMHLDSCPACTRMAVELRHLAGRAAAIAPMPDLALPDGPLTRLVELVGHAKQQLTEVAGQTKAQTAVVVTRADASVPAYAAGARPGAAVALIAGCVALGGGATYCAVEGLPAPIRSIAQVEPEQHQLPKQPEQEEPLAEEPPVAPQPPPAAQPVQTGTPESQGQAPPPPPEPQPPDAAREFGLAAPEPTVQSPAQPTAGSTPRSAPDASAAGDAGGEFRP